MKKSAASLQGIGDLRKFPGERRNEHDEQVCAIILTMRALLLISSLLLQTPVIAPKQSVDEVVTAVSRNVKDFQELLPDFVCDERITSTALESGKIRTRKTVESVLTAVQKPSFGPDNRRLAFTETREIIAIDGKAVRKGLGMPKLPIAMFGGFSSLLSMTFSPQNLQFHTYKLSKLDEGRLLIDFATKEDQKELRTFLNGEGRIATDRGTAWIDATSYQVVRLERNFLTLPHDISRLKDTAEYGPTAIGDREFWLPLIMRSDVTDRDPKKTKVFLAAYTNCKKFVADIKILPR